MMMMTSSHSNYPNAFRSIMQSDMGEAAVLLLLDFLLSIIYLFFFLNSICLIVLCPSLSPAAGL